MKLPQGISQLAMLRDHGCYQSLGQCTARERVKRFAERVAPVAQTTHPSQAGLARVLNSLVVPPFLRRGILVFICAVAQRIDADRMEQLEVTMCDFKFKRNAKYR